MTATITKRTRPAAVCGNSRDDVLRAWVDDDVVGDADRVDGDQRQRDGPEERPVGFAEPPESEPVAGRAQGEQPRGAGLPDVDDEGSHGERQGGAGGRLRGGAGSGARAQCHDVEERLRGEGHGEAGDGESPPPVRARCAVHRGEGRPACRPAGLRRRSHRSTPVGARCGRAPDWGEGRGGGARPAALPGAGVLCRDLGRRHGRASCLRWQPGGWRRVRRRRRDGRLPCGRLVARCLVVDDWLLFGRSRA